MKAAAQIGLGNGGVNAFWRTECGGRGEQLAGNLVNLAVLISLNPAVLKRAAGVPYAGAGCESKGGLFVIYANGFSVGYIMPFGWLNPMSVTPRYLNTSNRAFP